MTRRIITVRMWKGMHVEFAQTMTNERDTADTIAERIVRHACAKLNCSVGDLPFPIMSDFAVINCTTMTRD